MQVHIQNILVVFVYQSLRFITFKAKVIGANRCVCCVLFELSLECLDLQISFMVCWYKYIFIISWSRLNIKVMACRSRSYERNTHVQMVCYRLNGTLVLVNLQKIYYEYM